MELNKIIEKFINNKPLISEKKNQQTKKNQTLEKSFFQENPQIAQVRPSHGPGFFHVIKGVFNSSSNSQTIARIFDRSSKKHQQSMNEFSSHSKAASYFKKYLKGEEVCDKEFNNCMQFLEQYYKNMHSIQETLLKGIDSSSEKEKLQKKVVSEIKGLKNGQFRLIQANDHPENQVFYFFSKNEQGITFKIIGRGKTLVELSGIEEISVGGKIKIPSVVSYKNIPEIDEYWLSALFNHSLLGDNEFETRHLSALVRDYSSFREKIDLEKEVVSKTEDFVKTFWLAIKQTPKMIEKKSKDSQAHHRLRLRIELTALFDLFQWNKKSLIQDSEEFLSLESMLKHVSQKTLTAYKKGHITKVDLDEISKDLEVIRHALIKAKPISSFSVDAIKNIEMEVYTSNHISSLHINKPQVIENQVLVIDENRQPTSKPKIEHKIIPFSIQKNNLKIFKNLANAGKNQCFLIIKALLNIDFDPYKITVENGFFGTKYKTEDNKLSQWSHLNRTDVDELLKNCYNISSILADELEKNFTLDGYDAFIKISLMMKFLNDKYYKEMYWGISSYLFSDFYQIKSGFSFSFFGKTEYEEIERTGACIHALNIKTYKQLSDYFHASKKNENIDSDPQGWLDKQAELLSRLKKSKISSSFRSDEMEKWILPLKHPFLLGAYRNVGMQVIGKIKATQHILDNRDPNSETVKKELEDLKLKMCHRYGIKTQEAMMDDPFMVATFLEDELKKFHEYFQNNLSRFEYNQEKAKKVQSPKSSKDFRKFSQEEMSAILLLTRSRFPQAELMGFMEKYGYLLEDKEICNFVNLLFFHPSLLKQLDENVLFRKSLLSFLDEKLEKLVNQFQNDSKVLSQFLFFAEFTNKIDKICEVQGYQERPKRQFNFKQVDEFQKLKGIHPHLHRIKMLCLYEMINRDELTLDDAIEFIKQYNLMKSSPCDPLDYDPRIMGAIEMGHRAICVSIKEFIGKDESAYILDALCQEMKLPLDHSEWKGDFPEYTNSLYKIDLSRGTVLKIRSNFSLSSLPLPITSDPVFSEVFKDVDLKTLNVELKKINNINIYVFTDIKGISCRIEEENGIIRYYRTLPQLGELQAVSFSKLQAAGKFLPGIFDQHLYIDPNDSSRGFCISDEDQLLFKIKLIESSNKAVIKEVTDCRGVQESAGWKVGCAVDLQHPVVNKLGCFEHPSKILVWSKGEHIEKIELTRFGLSFAIQNNTLICLDPQYAGYMVDLEASTTEQRDFPFSLLLKPKDPLSTIPKKLLVPDSKALKIEWKIASNRSISGLHRLIETIGEKIAGLARLPGLSLVVDGVSKCLSVLMKIFSCAYNKLMSFSLFQAIRNLIMVLINFFKMASEILGIPVSLCVGIISKLGELLGWVESQSPQLIFEHTIELKEKKHSHRAFNIRPFTNAVYCDDGVQMEHFIELVKHALKYGKAELAYQYLSAIKMDPTVIKKSQKELFEFLKTDYSGSGLEAAVKIKCIKMLEKAVGKHPECKKFMINCSRLKMKYAKIYFAHGFNIPEPLILSKQEIKKCALLIQKEDSNYVKTHLFPYFSAEQTQYSVPIKKWNLAKVENEKKQIEKFDYSDRNYISNVHFDRGFYDWTGFSTYSSDPIQCVEYFLPLYRTLLEKGLKDPEFLKIKWTLELSRPKTEFPVNREEFAHYLLYTVLKCREQNISINDLPKPPEAQKKSNDNYFIKDDPFEELLNKLTTKCETLKKQLKIEAIPQIEIKVFNINFKIDENKKSSVKSRKEIERKKSDQLQRKEDLVDVAKSLENFNLENKHDFFITEGQAILFKEEEINNHFNPIKLALPNISINIDTAVSCEKTALEDVKKNLNDFHEKHSKQMFREFSNVSKINGLQVLLEHKKKELLKDKNSLKERVDKQIHFSKDSEEQVALFGKMKLSPSYTDLMLALLQNNDLDDLKNQLPKDTDLKSLKNDLIAYFNAEITSHMIQICENKIIYLSENHKDLSKDQLQDEAEALFQLMTRKRHYSPEKNADLLLFELFSFITFRKLNENANQLNLLLDMLKDPNKVTQAVTGAGKTKVLSVLRALMRPHGKNLVTLKVLTPLYNQTIEVMQSILGETFKRAIYPLRFDLKVPLIKSRKVEVIDENSKEENNIKVEVFEESVFKEIYEKMLDTIQAKGLVVTDYKSLPLLEEKFWKLSKEIGERIANLDNPTPIEIEHLIYLQKILSLLSSREECSMDEFDRPNRPIHRIQIPLTNSKDKPAKFLIDCSLKIYQELLKEENLLLEKNMQGEISEKTRMKCIENVAQKIANELATEEVSLEVILNYFLYGSEDVLTKINDWDAERKDKLAFYKDQFYTFLPLTLSQSGKTRYVRSDDGKRTLPCEKGEKHDAKFGSIIEEINYIIQDYIQTGVTFPEIKDWILVLQKEQSRNAAKGRFAEVFGEEKTLQPSYSEVEIQKFVNEINNNRERKLYFLRRRLEVITLSGEIISMDPQNNLSMSNTTSGISATLGALDSSHRKFQVDEEIAGEIQAEMIYRLVSRVEGSKIVEYDPQKPMELFKLIEKEKNICALIDGSGAYKEYQPKEVSEKMMTDRSLKRVGFHNKEGRLDFVGNVEGSVKERGFYFSQENTRGADVDLEKDGCGVVTVNHEGTIEDFNQQEGRMRLKTQKLLIARSKYAPELKTVEDVITKKIIYASKKQAEDLFREKKQELEDIPRTYAKLKLLSINVSKDLNEYLETFKKYESLFIKPASPTYQQEGSYFEKNKKIQKKDCKPGDVLKDLQKKLILSCCELGLKEAAEELKKINYTGELIKKLPDFVLSLDNSIETGLELQVEEELQQELMEEVEEDLEFELEFENEFEVQRQQKIDLPYYLPRYASERTDSLNKIHKAYDDKLLFTESFLPLNRKGQLFARKPFDDKMNRVGIVFVACELENEFAKFLSFCRTDKSISNVLIGDLLDDTVNVPKSLPPGFFYDLRSRKVTAFGFPSCSLKTQSVSEKEVNEFIKTEEFKRLMIQIRFFDGQIDGYEEEELMLMKHWISNNPTLRHHFENEILKYRDEIKQNYKYSQIFKVFESFKN